MILKADAGMDFAGFYTFMVIIAWSRLLTLREYLKERKLYPIHNHFNAKSISGLPDDQRETFSNSEERKNKHWKTPECRNYLLPPIESRHVSRTAMNDNHVNHYDIFHHTEGWRFCSETQQDQFVYSCGKNEESKIHDHYIGFEHSKFPGSEKDEGQEIHTEAEQGKCVSRWSKVIDHNTGFEKTTDESQLFKTQYGQCQDNHDTSEKVHRNIHHNEGQPIQHLSFHEKFNVGHCHENPAESVVGELLVSNKHCQELKGPENNINSSEGASLTTNISHDSKEFSVVEDEQSIEPICRETLQLPAAYLSKAWDKLSSDILPLLLVPEGESELLDDEDPSSQFTYEEEPDIEPVYEQEPEERGRCEAEPDRDVLYEDEVASDGCLLRRTGLKSSFWSSAAQKDPDTLRGISISKAASSSIGSTNSSTSLETVLPQTINADMSGLSRDTSVGSSASREITSMVREKFISPNTQTSIKTSSKDMAAQELTLNPNAAVSMAITSARNSSIAGLSTANNPSEDRTISVSSPISTSIISTRLVTRQRSPVAGTPSVPEVTCLDSSVLQDTVLTESSASQQALNSESRTVSLCLEPAMFPKQNKPTSLLNSSADNPSSANNQDSDIQESNFTGKGSLVSELLKNKHSLAGNFFDGKLNVSKNNFDCGQIISTDSSELENSEPTANSYPRGGVSEDQENLGMSVDSPFISTETALSGNGTSSTEHCEMQQSTWGEREYSLTAICCDCYKMLNSHSQNPTEIRLTGAGINKKEDQIRPNFASGIKLNIHSAFNIFNSKMICWECYSQRLCRVSQSFKKTHRKLRQLCSESFAGKVEQNGASNDIPFSNLTDQNRKQILLCLYTHSVLLTEKSDNDTLTFEEKSANSVTAELSVSKTAPVTHANGDVLLSSRSLQLKPVFGDGNGIVPFSTISKNNTASLTDENTPNLIQMNLSTASQKKTYMSKNLKSTLSSYEPALCISDIQDLSVVSNEERLFPLSSSGYPRLPHDMKAGYDPVIMSLSGLDLPDKSHPKQTIAVPSINNVHDRENSSWPVSDTVATKIKTPRLQQCDQVYKSSKSFQEHQENNCASKEHHENCNALENEVLLLFKKHKYLPNERPSKSVTHIPLDISQKNSTLKLKRDSISSVHANFQHEDGVSWNNNVVTELSLTSEPRASSFLPITANAIHIYRRNSVPKIIQASASMSSRDDSSPFAPFLVPKVSSEHEVNSGLKANLEKSYHLPEKPFSPQIKLMAALKRKQAGQFFLLQHSAAKSSSSSKKKNKKAPNIKTTVSPSSRDRSFQSSRSFSSYPKHDVWADRLQDFSTYTGVKKPTPPSSKQADKLQDFSTYMGVKKPTPPSSKQTDKDFYTYDKGVKKPATPSSKQTDKIQFFSTYNKEVRKPTPLFSKQLDKAEARPTLSNSAKDSEWAEPSSRISPYGPDLKWSPSVERQHQTNVSTSVDYDLMKDASKDDHTSESVLHGKLSLKETDLSVYVASLLTPCLEFAQTQIDDLKSRKPKFHSKLFRKWKSLCCLASSSQASGSESSVSISLPPMKKSDSALANLETTGVSELEKFASDHEKDNIETNVTVTESNLPEHKAQDLDPSTNHWAHFSSSLTTQFFSIFESSSYLNSDKTPQESSSSHPNDIINQNTSAASSAGDHSICPYWAHCGHNLALFDLQRVAHVLRDMHDQQEFPLVRDSVPVYLPQLDDWITELVCEMNEGNGASRTSSVMPECKQQ